MIKKAAIFSALVTAAAAAVNWIAALFWGVLPLAVPILGGECRVKVGFGMSMTTLYPMTETGTVVHSTTQLGFDPISLLVCYLLIFLVSLLILSLRKRKKA